MIGLFVSGIAVFSLGAFCICAGIVLGSGKWWRPVAFAAGVLCYPAGFFLFGWTIAVVAGRWQSLFATSAAILACLAGLSFAQPAGFTAAMILSFRREAAAERDKKV